MPTPIDIIESPAALLLIDNIDTDQIIPSREIKSVSRDGLAQGLFAGWRYLSADGRQPDPDFVLNKPEFERSQILICGRNFGCGSSREHAVWAIAEYGIRCIIAESFGAIFQQNCARNGVLAITLTAPTLTQLITQASEQNTLIAVDLNQQRITAAGLETQFEAQFDIEPYAKELLSKGLDPISLTLAQQSVILDFIRNDRAKRPWVYS